MKVEVKWIDSQSMAGWHDKVTFFVDGDDMEMKSLGYLIKDEERYICLAQSDGDHTWGEILMIPRFAITNMRQLDEGYKDNKGTVEEGSH